MLTLTAFWVAVHMVIVVVYGLLQILLLLIGHAGLSSIVSAVGTEHTAFTAVQMHQMTDQSLGGFLLVLSRIHTIMFACFLCVDAGHVSCTKLAFAVCALFAIHAHYQWTVLRLAGDAIFPSIRKRLVCDFSSSRYCVEWLVLLFGGTDMHPFVAERALTGIVVATKLTLGSDRMWWAGHQHVTDIVHKMFEKSVPNKNRKTITPKRIRQRKNQKSRLRSEIC
jgi:hypothetical protein